VAPKDQELRAVMTRIPEGLRRRLDREARWHRRSMNAEIVARLQQSFDVPDQTDYIVSQIESAIDSAIDSVNPSTGLDQIQSQIRAILSHLGLPDPVEETMAKAKAQRAAVALVSELESEVRKHKEGTVPDPERVANLVEKLKAALEGGGLSEPRLEARIITSLRSAQEIVKREGEK
jgi:chorismate mutase